jgi:hypothetical protein
VARNVLWLKIYFHLKTPLKPLKTHLSIQNGLKTQNQIGKDFSLAALICFSRQG